MGGFQGTGSHTAQSGEWGACKPLTRSRAQPFSSELLRVSTSQPAAAPKKSIRKGLGHSGPCALRKRPQRKRRHRGSPHSPWEAPEGQAHLGLAVRLPVALRPLLMLRSHCGCLGACQGAWLTALRGAPEPPSYNRALCSELPAPKRGPRPPVLTLAPGATGHQPSNAEPPGPPTELSRPCLLKLLPTSAWTQIH